MITEILQYLRNWFVLKKYFGDFEIVNGNIVLEQGEAFTLNDGQYFRVIGSSNNDGVWKYHATEMEDETFSGAVWALSIPKALINLIDEIQEWQTKYGGAVASPWQSESYSRGAYSRSKATGSDSAASWENAFRGRLSAWRKI